MAAGQQVAAASPSRAVAGQAVEQMKQAGPRPRWAVAGQAEEQTKQAGPRPR